MAAFLHVWLKRDSLSAVQYAIDLFERGRASVGNLPIVPSQDLLKQDYQALVSSHPPPTQISVRRFLTQQTGS